MKDKIDFSIIKALLKKQWIEQAYSYKRGNFDIVGFILRLLISAAFVAVFVVFFGRFVDIYLAVKTNNALDTDGRIFELLTVAYTVLIVAMTVGAVGQINKQIFGADDIKMLAAMPVPTKSLYTAKLIFIYGGQFVLNTVCVLAVNLTLGAHTHLGGTFYLITVLTCFLLPLITIAVASLLALPYRVIRQKLKDHFAINFIIITAITGLMFYAYSWLLEAVKEMLIGDSLRYFFNERLMTAINNVCRFLYPSRWIANIFLGVDTLVSVICIIAFLAICITVSMVIIRSILISVLQSRMSGSAQFVKKNGEISPKVGGFWLLVKKEFLVVFRTPSYMFSYFSVAVIMPLMVYSCMSISSSLVVRLVGLDCNLELGLFLTLLFGALTNVFCATNISRDGAMFYSIKALPISHKNIFFSKVFMCMTVTVVSQLVSAVLLFATGFVSWHVALVLFAVGTVFSFAIVCIATRYDFEHARFSTEEDGEIKESNGVVSVIVVLGLIISFVVGGAVFVSRILLLLRGANMPYVSYLIACVSAIAFAAVAYWYFIRRLESKYYEFDGGNI